MPHVTLTGMNPFRSGLVVLLLVLMSGVQAQRVMRIPIDFKVSVDGAAFTVNASSGGFPVSLGKFEAVLTNAQNANVVVPLEEQRENGSYKGPTPEVTPGAYTLTIRDVTYVETVEVQQAVTWPPSRDLNLKLIPPPRAPGNPSLLQPWSVIGGLVLLAGLALWAWRRRVAAGAPAN